ncbi:hypothetical protein GSI_01222 [Ganoderma sinense ZZ0214-1]|uniref:Uncharacterized protein n=1 Tax=Ganoderma sinense ZZ0214-1 TaxID=1077348 RepID=A0A2G8SVB3_9APHY|nr:hypothetical protein GSI_01222 [Ganoderma sinense ZZ0214-1]
MDLDPVETVLRSFVPAGSSDQDAQASPTESHLQIRAIPDLQPIPSLTLETIPQDVFRLIAQAISQKKGALKCLSRTSHYMRAACMPILFSRCTAYPSGEMGIPPGAIRPYVSHLTYFNPAPPSQSPKKSTVDWDLHLMGCSEGWETLENHPAVWDVICPVVTHQTGCPTVRRSSADFRKRLPSSEPVPPPEALKRPRLELETATNPGAELDYFPALRSVSFQCTLKLTHMDLMKKCLANNSLLSVEFTRTVRWTGGHPDPRVDSPYPPNISITHLKHAPSVWRETISEMERRNMSAEIAIESQCLALITLGIAPTAEILELPMESAPIARMSELAWPRLRELSLTGRYYLRSQSTTLPRLLSRMPELRTLALCAAQPHALRLARAPILGHDPPIRVNLSQLRTLILAYPDPGDAIFSISAPNISHLSLRDWPRYYFHQDLLSQYDLERWASQLLNASECLRILRRMSLHYLEKLELVYQADHADEALLRYVASTFPCLAHLELHRYRNGGEVDYKHIAETLAPLARLRTLHLNLDFPDSTGPRTSCASQHSNTARHLAWFAAARTRGLEVADILEPHCPALEHAALLVHDASGSYWWRFRPARGRPEHERVEHERADIEE